MSLNSAFPLENLIVWEDPTPRNPAWNMAIDEVLLRQLQQPWLRCYRWSEPSISIGFSQSLTKIPEEKRHWPMVRRWTGGGVVVHDGDWTYTLGVPAHIPFSDERAGEVYRWIHEKMVLALAELKIEGANLQPEHTSDGMGVCFIEPAKFDVVWQGRKVAGAAQRRTKLGLLHQGTIQDMPMPEGFLSKFAGQLCQDFERSDFTIFPEKWISLAQELVDYKYSSDSWTHEKSVRPKA